MITKTKAFYFLIPFHEIDELHHGIMGGLPRVPPFDPCKLWIKSKIINPILLIDLQFRTVHFDSFLLEIHRNNKGALRSMSFERIILLGKAIHSEFDAFLNVIAFTKSGIGSLGEIQQGTLV